MNRYQKAAAVWNNRQIQLSRERYYANPKICKYCGNIIPILDGQKAGDVRKKNFCNHSCSAKFNNAAIYHPRKRNILPSRKRYDYLDGCTKGELLNKKGAYYRFRAIIRKHAQWVYEQSDGDKKCKICGYDKHVEVCHIKSVSSFNDDALITIINDLTNLVGMCPNHHWEFDHGLITI